MTNPRPTTIRIVTVRGTNRYALLVGYSDGTEQPLDEEFDSVADAQDYAQHVTEQLGDDLGSTVTIEPATDLEAH
jgi:hypothetical protein